MIRVGLGVTLPPPAQEFIAFGLAGALAPGLQPGDVVTAGRIVDSTGRALWEGEPVTGIDAARVTICSGEILVDDADERADVAVSSGADAVDMESARLAETGRLVGVVRVISDTADQPLRRLGRAVTSDGGVDWRAVVSAFALDPIGSIRTATRARRSLAALERAAQALASAQTRG